MAGGGQIAGRRAQFLHAVDELLERADFARYHPHRMGRLGKPVLRRIGEKIGETRRQCDDQEHDQHGPRPARQPNAMKQLDRSGQHQREEHGERHRHEGHVSEVQEQAHRSGGEQARGGDLAGRRSWSLARRALPGHLGPNAIWRAENAVNHFSSRKSAVLAAHFFRGPGRALGRRSASGCRMRPTVAVCCAPMACCTYCRQFGLNALFGFMLLSALFATIFKYIPNQPIAWRDRVRHYRILLGAPAAGL